MQQKTLLGLFVITSLLLASCATGSKFTSAPAPQVGNALLYIYRTGSIVGAANSPNIIINGKCLARLTNGGYETCEVPQGTVIFTDDLVPGNALGAAVYNHLESPQERLRIKVEAGKTYYIRWHLAHCALTVEDEAAGLKDISGLHLVTP